MKERSIVVLGTLPLLAGAVLLLGLRRSEVPAPAAVGSPAPQDSPAPLARRPAGGYPGVIVAGHTAEFGAEFPGEVTHVWGEPGQRVKAGDRLVQLDPSTAAGAEKVVKAQLQQQASGVERAQAELNEARDLLRRMQEVPEGVSDRALVSAQTRRDAAKAALAEARAALSMQRAKLGQQRTQTRKHLVTAPFDGIVVSVQVDPGDTVAPGAVLARMITDDLYVRFALPPAEVPAQMEGQAVKVSGASLDAPLAATVSDVQPEVDVSAQLVFARARLGQDAAALGSLISGMRVEVTPGPQWAVPQAPGADSAPQAAGADSTRLEQGAP